jgi:hypothetical protein
MHLHDGAAFEHVLILEREFFTDVCNRKIHETLGREMSLSPQMVNKINSTEEQRGKQRPLGANLTSGVKVHPLGSIFTST